MAQIDPVAGCPLGIGPFKRGFEFMVSGRGEGHARRPHKGLGPEEGQEDQSNQTIFPWGMGHQRRAAFPNEQEKHRREEEGHAAVEGIEAQAARQQGQEERSQQQGEELGRAPGQRKGAGEKK